MLAVRLVIVWRVQPLVESLLIQIHQLLLATNRASVWHLILQLVSVHHLDPLHEALKHSSLLLYLVHVLDRLNLPLLT